jgi:hypothetical protein
VSVRPSGRPCAMRFALAAVCRARKCVALVTSALAIVFELMPNIDDANEIKALRASSRQLVRAAGRR